MIKLGRRCENGKHAIESPERLFGRLVAMELIGITLSEALVNAKDYPYVREQLMELYTNSEQTVEAQIANHKEDELFPIASRKKKACVDAFRDSINYFINYGDENLMD